MTADLHPDTGLPRPGTCCGVCPPIAGGGWDCTCPGMPGCPAAGRAETTTATAEDVLSGRCCAHPKCPGGSLCCCVNQPATDTTKENS